MPGSGGAIAEPRIQPPGGVVVAEDAERADAVLGHRPPRQRGADDPREPGAATVGGGDDPGEVGYARGLALRPADRDQSARAVAQPDPPVHAPGADLGPDPRVGGTRERLQLGRVSRDRSDFRSKYDPGHPAADASGLVKLPNVNSLIETMDMREAQRSYEANLNVISSTRRMIQRTIDILRA